MTVAASGVLAMIAVIATWVLTVRSLRRRNRVSPRVPSTAPLAWLWSPRLPARVHRELGRSVAAARGCVTGSASGLALHDLVVQLESHACALDAQLVIADRAPEPGRRRLLHELRSEAADVGALTERVIRMNRAWSGAAPSSRGLAPVRERIEALEAALGDLDRIDRLPESRERRRTAG